MMKLDKEQQYAVDCNDKYIVCLASAGSGKTSTLISRIRRIADEIDDPSQILALTFTNAASFEMHERYDKLETSKLKLVKQPQFKTFHAFCYHLICNDHVICRKLGYNKIPQISTEGEDKQIQTKVETMLNYKLPKSFYKKDKIAMRKFETFIKAIKKEYISRNLISFDLLLEGVTYLFLYDDDCIKKYKNHYKYILVDEFQDTDPRQWKFVQSFKDSNIFLVGDISQSIYGWRNADSSIMKRLCEEGSKWTVIKLYNNYRSTKPICEYANKIIKNYDEAYKIDMVSHKDGPEIDIEPYRADFRHVIDQNALKKITSTYKTGTTAILARTNKEVEQIQMWLKYNQIEYNSNNQYDEVINILKSCIDENYLESWLTSKLPKEEYIRYIRNKHLNEEYDYRITVSASSYTQQEYANIIYIQVILNNDKLKASEKFDNICKICKIYKNINSKIVNINEDISNEDLIKLIQLHISNLTSNALYVGTVHSSKGLEYDNVAVVNVESKSWKLDDEELRNLFYVAVTRAKTNLSIFINMEV